jgi:hypothetical protein
MKVMTIVGTRPEIIKMSRVMAELEKFVDHVLVHTGQNYDYELNEIFFEELGVKKPDYFLDVAGKSVAYTIGNVISKSDDIFEIEKPDAVLLYGDTNSCLAVISAKRRKIPVFHFEAGNRCFDQRVPEELNRKVLDHLSDINLPLSDQAKSYLIAEGIKPETIIKTGSPMREVLNANMKKIKSFVLIISINLLLILSILGFIVTGPILVDISTPEIDAAASTSIPIVTVVVPVVPTNDKSASYVVAEALEPLSSYDTDAPPEIATPATAAVDAIVDTANNAISFFILFSI